jgi:hypothetical protein
MGEKVSRFTLSEPETPITPDAENRQSGSRRTLWHEARKVPVTIPIRTGCDIGRGLAVRILKNAGFSVEDFLRLR